MVSLKLQVLELGPLQSDHTTHTKELLDLETFRSSVTAFKTRKHSNSISIFIQNRSYSVIILVSLKTRQETFHTIGLFLVISQNISS